MSFAAALLLGSMPLASAEAPSALDVSVTRAVVSPDGTTAGETTDIVVTFVHPDPAVPGISLMEGGTVAVTLPDGFVDTGVGVNSVALLQGWPQSPPAPPPAFPWVTTVSGNTITATLTADYLVGAAGPGPKAAHLILNSFRNPGPGVYNVDLVIQPGPAPSAAYAGTGSVRVIPKARPSINVVSVFSGGGPPPPFNNPIYQTVSAGTDSHDIGLYLWDGGSSVADDDVNPYVGVAIAMANEGHGRLVDGKRTVGHVWIDAPAGADDYALASGGTSFLGISAVTAVDVGILIVTLRTDPDVTGEYRIKFRMNNGNTQELFITAD